MASIGKFTGFSKGRFVDPWQTHGTASIRKTSSVPGNMRFTFRDGRQRTQSQNSIVTKDANEKLPQCLSTTSSLSTTDSCGAAFPQPGLKKNTTFSHGESLIEAAVSKHPQVELIDTCKGSTAYALKQHFAIVRHADRLDRTDEWETHPDRDAWPNDTPLSQLGHDHASEAGEEIKKFGKSFGLIISSPYLRCAQTASRIAQVLKCPIKFDLDFGEVFDRSSLVGKITGPQHRSPQELELLLRRDFPDVDFIQDSESKIKIAGKQQVFPESLDAARMRFCFKVQQSLQRAASKLTSILVVTHGDAVGCVLGMMQKDWTIKHVKYAAFALASRQVVVLEKGSMEVKSDEPVYEHEWDLQLSEGLKYDEVHPFSRKRAYAEREYKIRKMKANPGELDTPYIVDDKQLASFMKVLQEFGANREHSDSLVKEASRAPTFRNYASIVGEPRSFDGPILEEDEEEEANSNNKARHRVLRRTVSE